MSIIRKKQGQLEYLVAEGISVPHCFTTRRGGVSKGYLDSLNIGLHRGDDPKNVEENFRILADALGIQPEDFVLTKQIHSDIVVKVGEEEIKFEKLPSNLSIANFGQSGVVVSESKEAMNTEVEGMLRNSKQVIESIPYHEKVVASCDVMLRELNPSFKKEKEQEEKIGLLEQKMNGMEGTLTDIREMLSLALNKSKKNEV